MTVTNLHVALQASVMLFSQKKKKKNVENKNIA